MTDLIYIVITILKHNIVQKHHMPPTKWIFRHAISVLPTNGLLWRLGEGSEAFKKIEEQVSTMFQAEQTNNKNKAANREFSTGE